MLNQKDGKASGLSFESLKSYAQSNGETGGDSNQWGTGKEWYQQTRHISSGSSYTDVSTDGGKTWKLDGKFLGISVNYGTASGSGNTLTRTVTVNVTYDMICCAPGSTGRCDYPQCL